MAFFVKLHLPRPSTRVVAARSADVQAVTYAASARPVVPRSTFHSHFDHPSFTYAASNCAAAAQLSAKRPPAWSASTCEMFARWIAINLLAQYFGLVRAIIFGFRRIRGIAISTNLVIWVTNR